MSRLFNFEVAWLRPPRAMQDVYTQFATELMRQKSGQLDLLDEEDGLLYRWSAICAQQLALLSAELATPETVELWTLERNTWQLVRALYTERLAEPVPSSSRQPSAYAAPFAVVQAVVTASPALLELSTVRDWLSNIVDSRASAIEVRAGYYTFTKNSLKQQRRTGKKGEARVVTELDPDAGLRQGSRLQVEDAVYERALVRSLYAYVRSGELDLAVDLCRKSDQSWRAASLSGGNFCSDPLLKVAGDGMDDGLGDARGMDDDARATGNKRRKLWKKMCRRAAATTSLDPYERALYGSVSGDVASVLPVCETWEDHLWVHISALLEQGVEDGLELEAARGNGAFWVNGATVPTPSSAPVRTEESTKKELASIFDGLLKGTKLGGGKDPFHVSQTYLILGNINALFENFLTRIEALGEELDPETSAQLLRFFAHLILTMRLMGVPMNEATANRIIQGYIQVLEATEQDDTLIAFYASNLDDEQSTESYAQFLLTFGPTSDLDTRRMALLKTREHGLDLAKIACRTVELVLSDILLESPETEPNASLETRITLSEKDTGLIRSLEWLTFDESTHEEALRQANALCRYFMGLAKPHAARALLLLLPRQLVSNLTASQAAADTNTTSDHALRREMTEYLDFTAFFACLETHTHWTEVWSRKPKSTATKLERASFKDGIFGLVSEFYTAAVELLGNNWLKRDVGEIIDTVDGRRRAVELARIRKIFVPELVMRVHLTLFETASLAPSHLETALSLANLVADEKTQLYLEFITPEQNRIGEYLQRVREAALVQLDGPKL